MTYLKSVMDQNFLEYASYVIKDRAIPDIADGLKPVQRRILYTMFRVDDGKFHKVANIIGETMKLHPHGDASIGSALVVLANKEYFIEKQGNFGNVFTGDPASAARYIEARLTPLAKEVLFNEEITEFIESYDGRLQEPVTLPCKIPLTLLIGAEGIAVGMSTRILPHNFQEVLQAQIAYLQQETFELYPDFATGGGMDITQYQQGNGKVRVRAKINLVDEKTLVIREIPFGVTTESLIHSIQEAVNKNKIKLSAINDYTTEAIEIELKTARGTKSRELVAPLYAFTECEISISVNLLVIQNNQPVQTSVNEVLKVNTDRLVNTLEQELEVELAKAEQKWHLKKLELFFIQKKIYQQLVEQEKYEDVLATMEVALIPLHAELKQSITIENIEKLLSIPIKRISKFDLQKTENELQELDEKIHTLQNHLKRIKNYTIGYLQKLLKKYGELYPRKTQITSFSEINKKEVVKSDLKVSWDQKEGYLGTEIKSDKSWLCSPYDRIVMFYPDGLYKVIRVPHKSFIGKDVLYITTVDEKQIFNLMYWIDSSKIGYAKRFCIEKFILDKEYRLFPEKKGAKILHFSVGNEVFVEVCYVPAPRLKKTKEIYTFDHLAVKGIGSRGNRVSPKAVERVKMPNSQQIEEMKQLSLISE